MRQTQWHQSSTTLALLIAILGAACSARSSGPLSDTHKEPPQPVVKVVYIEGGDGGFVVGIEVYDDGRILLEDGRSKTWRRLANDQKERLLSLLETVASSRFEGTQNFGADWEAVQIQLPEGRNLGIALEDPYPDYAKAFLLELERAMERLFGRKYNRYEIRLIIE